jgi:hypothetical protein
VWNEDKRIEKLRYIHRNPVERGTGRKSGTMGMEQLSTLRFRSRGCRGNRVPMDSPKKRADGFRHPDIPSRGNSPPCLSKKRRNKDGAPLT